MAGLSLEQTTAQHLGERLAIFIDNRLVLSPVLQTPIVGGRVYLDADFSPQQAERIARGLNAPPAESRPSR
jgi:preprotein translocase subunit SecD